MAYSSLPVHHGRLGKPAITCAGVRRIRQTRLRRRKCDASANLDCVVRLVHQGSEPVDVCVLQLQTQYQLPLTTWETDTRDADHPAPPSAVAHDGTIDALVAFRSKVRTCALHSLQRAKRETRTTPGASERGGEDGTDLAKSILRECDAVRDALATQSPACVVRDTKDGASSWHVR
eukprot:m.1023215 g.1023215  ORF g.1023215 m.1023215 type:complete len:176 (+) comp24096_c1_seq29:2996-3523(+)